MFSTGGMLLELLVLMIILIIVNNQQKISKLIPKGKVLGFAETMAIIVDNELKEKQKKIGDDVFNAAFDAADSCHGRGINVDGITQNGELGYSVIVWHSNVKHLTSSGKLYQFPIAQINIDLRRTPAIHVSFICYPSSFDSRYTVYGVSKAEIATLIIDLTDHIKKCTLPEKVKN